MRVVRDYAAQCEAETDVLDPRVGAASLAMPAVAPPLLADRSTVVFRLLLLNILLQLFDGLATHGGLLYLGVHEANPLLRIGFQLWGIGPTLLLFKTAACALLVLVYRIASDEQALPALGMLAAVYALCSLLPWLATFLAVLARYA
jgi:hypothetical protein